MKNKTVKALALLMTVTTVSMMGASSIYASDTETVSYTHLTLPTIYSV